MRASRTDAKVRRTMVERDDAKRKAMRWRNILKGGQRGRGGRGGENESNAHGAPVRDHNTLHRGTVLEWGCIATAQTKETEIGKPRQQHGSPPSCPHVLSAPASHTRS